MHASQPGGDRPRGSDLEHLPITALGVGEKPPAPHGCEETYPSTAATSENATAWDSGKGQEETPQWPRETGDRWLWAIRVSERQAAPGSNCLKKLILGDSGPRPTNGVRPRSAGTSEEART